MRKTSTVKGNLATIIKASYIGLKEIDRRDISIEMKLNELRTLHNTINGSIDVISFTGQYLEEMSLLLDIRREIISTIQKYIE